MDVVGKKDIVAVLLPKKETSQQPEDNFQSLSGSTSSESQPGTPSRGKELGYSITFIPPLQDCLIHKFTLGISNIIVGSPGFLLSRVMDRKLIGSDYDAQTLIYQIK